MTFGMEYGDVVEHITCPRCGSPAVIRARIRKGTRTYEDNLTCDKCHKVELVRMTTIDHMLDQRILLRLNRSLEKAKTHRDKQRIEAKIEEVKRRMNLHELIQFKPN